MTEENNTAKKNSIRAILSKIRLGFEMWEIFSAFTLALTLASILMWFSNLQPRHIQREFAWQDQNKNSLYNISLKVEASQSESAISLAYIPNKDQGACFENEFKKSQPLIKNNLIDELNALNTELLQIQKDSEDYHNYVEPSPSFETLSTSLDDYILQVKKQQTSNKALIQKDIEFKKYLTQLCQSKYDTNLLDTGIFKDFKSTVNGSNFSNREMYIYTVNTLEDLLQQLKGEGEPAKVEIILDSLVKAITKIFSLELKSDNQAGKLETSDFTQKVKDYEAWQKKFLTQNQNLGKKTVFIFEDKKIS
ncbi:MAG: hypothetical protein WCK98_06195 [bacterium]